MKTSLSSAVGFVTFKFTTTRVAKLRVYKPFRIKD